jgi:hypothetical protein
VTVKAMDFKEIFSMGHAGTQPDWLENMVGQSPFALRVDG